jgi:hypothetical protein
MEVEAPCAWIRTSRFLQTKLTLPGCFGNAKKLFFTCFVPFTELAGRFVWLCRAKGIGMIVGLDVTAQVGRSNAGKLHGLSDHRSAVMSMDDPGLMAFLVRFVDGIEKIAIAHPEIGVPLSELIFEMLKEYGTKANSRFGLLPQKRESRVRVR